MPVMHLVARVTKRKSALPDSKRDPEMGQLNSRKPTYGIGQVHYGSIWYHLAATPENGPVWQVARLQTAKFFSRNFFWIT